MTSKEMSQHRIGSFSTVRFEITRNQLDEYNFKQLILFCVLNGFSTLAAAGRDLLVAGLRAKIQSGQTQQKIESGARMRGITPEEYENILLAENGYDVKREKYNSVLKKYGAKSVDQLMDILAA